MPFTLALPVAVLPLRCCGLPISALVIGSLSPDLEYVLRFEPVSVISHTIPGLFLFCIPAGMLALWIRAPSLDAARSLHDCRKAKIAVAVFEAIK